MPDFLHRTVLKDEVVRLLQPKEGRVYVDGTLGGGGHAEALLEAGARVLGLDRDEVALAAATTRLARFGPSFQARQGRFGALLARLDAPVDGVLLDLGVSSPQLDVAERGFSFQADGPLDMRMGQDGPTAAELIQALPESELADLLYRLADERFSRPIARALKVALPTTTFQAVEAVKRAVPRAAWPRDTHVATRTFQALRMAVNAELEELDAALSAIPGALKPLGRAAVITFHSLEDRAVKQAFRAWSGRAPDDGPRGLPVPRAVAAPTFTLLTPKAVSASPEEVESNPRARSARLRAVEKRP